MNYLNWFFADRKSTSFKRSGQTRRASNQRRRVDAERRTTVQRRRTMLLESLEGRRLLTTVSVDPTGNLLIVDSSRIQNDDLSIVVDGPNYRITDIESPLTAGPGSSVDANAVLVPLADVTGEIIVDAGSGDDRLTIDRSGGNMPNNLTFDGGDGGFDTLEIVGGVADQVAFQFDNESDGNVDIDGSTITYVGLEPITSTISATTVVLNYSNASETITITDAGGGQTTVDSTAGEITTFNNPTGTLTINAGDTGNDAININSLAANFPANIIIDGQGGNDTLSISNIATGALVAIAPDAVNPTDQRISGLAAIVDVSGIELISFSGDDTQTLTVDPGTGNHSVRVDTGVAASDLITSDSLPNISVQAVNRLVIDAVTSAGGKVVTFVTAGLSAAPSTGYEIQGGADDTLVIEGGDAVNDGFRAANPPIGSVAIEHFNGNNVTVTETTGNLGRFQINTLGGDDSVRVDVAGAEVITVPITFDGGGDSDLLTILGTTISGSTDATYTPGPGVSEGRIEHVDGVNTMTIDFTGLEPVIDLVPGTLTVNGTNAGNAINMVTGPNSLGFPVGGAISALVSVDSFETIEFANKANLVINGLAGNDTIDGSTLPAGVVTNVTINGGDGNDMLTGTPSFDTINGGADNDTITGGLGADLQFGDAGNDTFVWNNGDGPDDNTGGADTDTFTFNGADGPGDVLALLPGIGDGSLVGAAFNLARTLPTAFTIEGVEIENINVNGLAGNDTVDGSALPAGIFTTVTINGGDGNDILTGTGGVDTINGGADNDTITGGLGADLQFGDAGEDTFVWNDGDGPDDNTGGADTDTFTFNGADGADDVLSLLVGPGDGSLAGAAFNLARTAPSAFTIEGVEIENINVNGLAGSDTIDGSALSAGIFTAVTINGGDGNDVLTGTGGVDTINGGADNDTITGGLGADLQFGDAGEDTFIWNNGDGPDDNTGGADTDTFTFNGADGADDVLALFDGPGDGSLASAAFNLARTAPSAFTIEGLDIENINVNGLAGSDTIDGSALSAGIFTVVTINGGDGNDLLTGTGGVDTINGGAENDTITGGLGADIQFGDAGDDTFIWNNGDGPDDNTGGADTDTFTFNGADGADDVITVGVGPGDGSLVGAEFNLERFAPSAFTIEGASIENVNVNGLAGADEFTVVPSTFLNVVVDGGDPTTTPGDTLNLDAMNNGVTISGNVSTVDGMLPITHLNIEEVNYANVTAFTIEADNNDNDIRVFVEGADTFVSIDGMTVLSHPTADMPVLTINGNGGNDTFTVDYADGNPIPSDGISFNGNGQNAPGGDSVVLDNGTATTVHHRFTNANDGTIDIDGSLITYTGLEPITDNLNAVNRIFTFNGGAETITLGDDVGVGNNLNLIDSTLGESVVFVSPTNSLTVNSGSGLDVINISTLDAMYAASLIVDGGVGAADSLTMTNVDLINTPGRGLTLRELETIAIGGGTISGNTASIGGGILIDNSTTVTTNATISGTTISNNVASAGAPPLEGGGGIYNRGANLTVNGGTIISGNTAIAELGSGGGIFSLGTLTVTDSTITGNDANRAGGGIEIAAGSGLTTLTNLTLSDNDALGSPGNGGGLHITGAGNSIITGGTVSGNTAAEEGGGLWNGTGTMTIDGVIIDGNIASTGNNGGNDQGGGGVFNAGGTLIIQGATDIRFNQATTNNGNGGGVMTVGGDVGISGSTIRGNVAARAGGGIENLGGVVTMNGTILGGLAAGDGNITGINGGGLHVSGIATTTLDDVFVRGNIAAEEGGGLWNSDDGVMTIRGGEIDRNVAIGNAADQGGGGIFNAGGTVNVQGTSIINNIAGGTLGSGGGILNDAGGTIQLVNLVVTDNTANRAGGGIEGTSGTTNTLSNVNLDRNNAGVAPAIGAPGNGGGLHITGTGDVTIVGGTVNDNVAAREGGGLWNDSGTMAIDGTSIERNVAFGGAADDGGGGIFNNAGTLDLDNVTLRDNEASGLMGSGGGLFSLAGVVTIDDSDVESNSANRAGGGIEVVAGTVTMTNTNLINNDVDGLGVSALAPNPGNGGGLHVTAAADVTVIGGMVDGNIAREEGGGLWNSTDGILNISATTIANNIARSGDTGETNQGGGGVFNNGGMLIIQNAASIIGNMASDNLGNGGGVMTVGGTVTIDSAIIQSNEASRAGGGIENNGGNVTLNNVTLGGPLAADGNVASINGGGLHASGASSVTIVNDGTVQNNIAGQEGGGLWNGPGMMTVNRTSITENTTNSLNNVGNDQGGGGVFNIDGTLDINDATISDNEALPNNGNGGGVMTVRGTVTIDDSFIQNNRAGRAGGGIENNDGDVTITNQIVGGALVAEGNQAVINGGGLHASGGNSVTTVNGGLFQNNIAGQEGGGLWNGTGAMFVNGTIITNNTANSGDGVLPNPNLNNDQGGGGVFNIGGVLDINDATITNNDALLNNGNGGGVMTVGGIVTIDDTRIQANQAARAGGGIENNNGNVTATNVTVGGPNVVDGNTAGINGGGLHASGLGSATIVDGGSFQNNTAEQEGGGLWNGNGALTIRNNTTITENTANSVDNLGNDKGGGGVFNIGGTLDVDDVTITDNVATANDGNGGGVMTVGGLVTIDNTFVGSNQAGRDGGGLHASGSSDVTVTGGTFQLNIAQEEGGGFWNGAGILRISGTNVTENTANSAANTNNDQGGGGVFNIGGTLDIDDVTITNNLAIAGNGNGGGVMTVGGNVTIDNTTIQNNDAARAGGGVENNNGNMTLTSVTLGGPTVGDGNTAGVNGGGLHSSGDNSVTIVDGGTIRNNIATQEGGGLWNGGGIMTIRNGALITENTANSAANTNNDQGGGGVFNIGGTLDIDDVTITNNLATVGNGNGGGVMTVGGNVTIDNTTIQNNDAARAGGGVENNNGILSLTNFTLGGPTPVDGNHAGVNGGGLHASGLQSITSISGGVIQNNVAEQEGGGLWNGSGQMSVDGTTITLNTANSGANAATDTNTNNDQGGGGVFNIGGALLIENSTITSNFATANRGNGGGVMTVGGGVEIENTLIQSNQAARAGGGVENNNGSVLLDAVTLGGPNPVDGNTAEVNGGGLHASGASVTTITGGSVQNNIADQEGGGVWSGADGTLTISNVLIDSNLARSTDAANSAQGGGGVFNDGGLLTIRDSVTVSNNTALDPDGSATQDDGGGGIFNNGGVVTISDGSSIEDNLAIDGAGNGGGILNLGGEIVVVDSTFAGNQAARAGGGLETIDGVVTLDNATFGGPVIAAGNTAGVNGGGLHISGQATVHVNDGTFQNNTALQEGGGLWNSSTGTLVINDATITGNIASGLGADQGGGGIFNAGGVLDIVGATINANIANGADGSGGGILNDAAGSLSITESTVQGNSSNRAGGGIEVTAGTTTTLTDVRLDQNITGVVTSASAPGNGGGLHVTGDADVTITGSSIANSTVDGNTAASEGGGLWNGAGTLIVTTTSIDGNTASGSGTDQAGGGVFNSSGVVSLLDVTLSNNTANTASGTGGGALNDLGTLNVRDSRIMDNDSGGLAYRTFSGIITNNTVSGNNGGGLRVLTGTANDDVVRITSNMIEINDAKLDYDESLGPISIQTGDGDDVIEIKSTAAGSPIVIDTGAGDDLIYISSDAPSNAGTLNGILGDITIVGGSQTSTNEATEIVTARNSIANSQSRSATVSVGDQLLISDVSSSTSNTYAINTTTFARAGSGVITFDSVETLDFTVGNGNDTVTVTDTAANNQLTLHTSGGDDEITIVNTGDASVLRVASQGGDDIVNIRSTGSGSVSLVDSGSQSDNVMLADLGASSGIDIRTGSGSDEITVGDTTTPATLNAGAPSLITIDGGENDDEFSINEVFSASLVDVLGGEGNDRFLLTAAGSNGDGTLTRLSDAADTRQLLIDGGGNGNAIRTFYEGITISQIGEQNETQVRNQEVGDTVIVDASSATTALDLQYLIVASGQGRLATGTTEVLDSLSVETIRINGGIANDALSVTSNIAFGIESSQQAIAFDGGAGSNDQLTVTGSDQDDRITVGPISGDATLEPIEIDNTETVTVNGNDGNDQLSNRSTASANLDGGNGNNIVLGGFTLDVLSVGSGESLLFGRIDGEIVPQRGEGEIVYDVNRDGKITALDALRVINSIDPNHGGAIAESEPAGYISHVDDEDVNGDGQVSAIDALVVINKLGLMSIGSTTAESEPLVANTALPSMSPLELPRQSDQPVVLGESLSGEVMPHPFVDSEVQTENWAESVDLAFDEALDFSPESVSDDEMAAFWELDQKLF